MPLGLGGVISVCLTAARVPLCLARISSKLSGVGRRAAEPSLFIPDCEGLFLRQHRCAQSSCELTIATAAPAPGKQHPAVLRPAIWLCILPPSLPQCSLRLSSGGMHVVFRAYRPSLILSALTCHSLPSPPFTGKRFLRLRTIVAFLFGYKRNIDRGSLTL